MRIISLFSGAGGLDLGFAQAGHKIVWAIDNWSDAVSTYKMNLGEHIILADIAEVESRSIPEADIIIGGFPCQGFSVANRNRYAEDKRNQLYLEFIRVLNEKQTPYFLAENVKGILSLEGGSVFKMILSDFQRIGYRVSYAVLNAADYGVPQTRERVILVGVRCDIDAAPPFPPRRTHAPRGKRDRGGLLPWISVEEALSGLPEPADDSPLSNHTCSQYKLVFNGYLGHRRLDPSKPAPTVTARGDHRGGVVVLPHPNGTRRMSPRETAIIQSFPIDYRFFGSNTSVYRQIANAVPPRLARSVAEGMLNLPKDASTAQERRGGEARRWYF